MVLELFKFFRRKKSPVDDTVPSPVEADVPVHRAGPLERKAKYSIGEVLRHRIHPFRGVVFDIDPEFSNTEEWYESIPEEARPHRNQPYYHLFAENESSHYVAYVSEQNLVYDDSGEPLTHPEILDVFDHSEAGYALKVHHTN